MTDSNPHEKEQTYLERTHGGQVFVGSDQDIFRALMLASSLGIYEKTGMIPTRGFTATKMLKAASGLTGNTYKRGEYVLAALELATLADVLKSEPRKDG